MQEEQATEATLQLILHGGRQCRRRTFCREQWYSLSLSLTLIRVLTFALRSRKSRGEQAAWRPVASEANPLYCRPTRQGVFRRTDLRVLIEEPHNTISIDYVMLRYSRNKGCFCAFGAVSVMAPVGRWGIRGSSLPAFGVSGERLKSRHRYCIIERSEFVRPEVYFN